MSNACNKGGGIKHRKAMGVPQEGTSERLANGHFTSKYFYKKLQANLHFVYAQEIYQLEAFNFSPCSTQSHMQTCWSDNEESFFTWQVQQINASLDNTMKRPYSDLLVPTQDQHKKLTCLRSRHDTATHVNMMLVSVYHQRFITIA